MPEEELRPASTASEIPNADTVRILLEKNLKWSQIMYEQNRRLSRRLLSIAIMGWTGVVLFIIFILLCAWWILPAVSSFSARAHRLPWASNVNFNNRQKELDQILNLLPVNDAQAVQLKAILTE